MSETCVCDPSFSTEVAAGEECPSCTPYHIYTAVLAIISLVWVIRVSWVHRGLPGWTYRSAVVTMALVFGVMRAIRGIALAVLGADTGGVSDLVWAQSYIIPTLVVLTALNIVSVHWYRVKVDIDFSKGYRSREERARIGLRGFRFFLVFTLVFAALEVWIYSLPANPNASAGLVNFTSLLVSPVLVGVSAFVSGFICIRSGRAIGSILKGQGSGGAMGPDRMNVLITRVGRISAFCGFVAAAGGTIAYLGGGDDANRFVVKSYAFRFAETAAIMTLASVYKLPTHVLRSSLDRIKRRSSELAKLQGGPDVPSARAMETSTAAMLAKLNEAAAAGAGAGAGGHEGAPPSPPSPPTPPSEAPAAPVAAAEPEGAEDPVDTPEPAPAPDDNAPAVEAAE